MILDDLNLVMEVRINDMESADVPKYGTEYAAVALLCQTQRHRTHQSDAVYVSRFCH